MDPFHGPIRRSGQVDGIYDRDSCFQLCLLVLQSTYGLFQFSHIASLLLKHRRSLLNAS